MRSAITWRCGQCRWQIWLETKWVYTWKEHALSMTQATGQLAMASGTPRRWEKHRPKTPDWPSLKQIRWVVSSPMGNQQWATPQRSDNQNKIDIDCECNPGAHKVMGKDWIHQSQNKEITWVIVVALRGCVGPMHFTCLADESDKVGHTRAKILVTEEGWKRAMW